MTPKQILLVDDSPSDTELAIDALRQYHLGNEVISLRDGAEALDYLYRTGKFAGRATADPAIILLDLKMPKVDGLEVLRRIKGDPKMKIIPIVMMTSSREESDLVQSYQLGVNGYIVKPLNFHEFVEAIRVLGAFWVVLNEQPKSNQPSG
jgi:CheY-like chemotaxis protein